MKAQDLRNWISGLTQDIDFEYRGKLGSICPFSHTDISLYYDGEEKTVSSVDDAMTEPFIDGHALVDICEELGL